MRTTTGSCRLVLLAIAITLCASTARAQTADEVRRSIETLQKVLERLEAGEDSSPIRPVTYGRLQTLLETLEGQPVILRGKDERPIAIRFLVRGYKVLALLDPDGGVLQFSFGVGGSNVTPEKLNRWNREVRFTRAFTKEVRGREVATLEAEYMVGEGMSDDRLRLVVELFRTAIGRFLDEVCR